MLVVGYWFLETFICNLNKIEAPSIFTWSVFMLIYVCWAAGLISSQQSKHEIIFLDSSIKVLKILVSKLKRTVAPSGFI